MDSISLREVTGADVEMFYDYQRDPIAIEMAAFPAREKEAHLQHWARIQADETTINRTILFGDEVAGSVGSWVEGDKRLIGYWIGRGHWGKGVATSALGKFVDLLSERPLFAHVAKHNLGSIRVLEKCGFEAQSEETGKDGVVELLMRLD
jgi:RimJ/RimL family protein N-acetyltransferase